MVSLLHQLWQDEQGQDLTEYALLLVLVALGAIAAMNNLSTALTSVFSNASTNLTAT